MKTLPVVDKYEIHLVDRTPAGERKFELIKNGEVIATNTNARTLSNFAFADGAESVVWNFDLKLAER